MMTPAAEINLKQTRREYVHRYYSRVISLALSALDDGSQSPPPSREFIEWVISALGFHVEDWTRLTDEELVEHIGCEGRLNVEITRGRILDRIKQQRKRLLKWQEKEGNPILIDHRLFFQHAEDSRPGNPIGKTYSEYQLPFGELIADIIEEAPAETRNDKLKRVVARHVKDYLARFDGTARRDKKKKEHSPESDLKRAATVAKKAVEREEKKSGKRSAIGEFIGVFSREFSGWVKFSPFDDKSINDSGLESEPVRETCPPDFSGKSINDNNLTQKRRVTNVTPVTTPETEKMCHVGEEKNVAQIPVIGRTPERGSHPPEGAEAGRGCDPSSGSYMPDLAPELAAIDSFLSVGCDRFEWFYVDPATDKKTGAYHEVTANIMRAEISNLVGDAERGGVSFVVRPRNSKSGAILQNDDCDAATALVLEPFSFLVEETSENNFQVWLAFKEEWDKAEVSARLFSRLRELGWRANPGANGATRWPGSINQKLGRNSFRVRVDSVNPGRFTTPSELDSAGLLGDPPKPADLNWQPNGKPREWPNYGRCLEDKNNDRSDADAQFVYFSLTRNRTPEEIAKKLAEVSTKAKECGEKYINRTVARGVEYLRGLGVSI